MRYNQCSDMVHGIQSYIKPWEINDYCICNLITAIIYSEAMFSLKTNSKHSRTYLYCLHVHNEKYGRRLWEKTLKTFNLDVSVVCKHGID